MTRQVVELKLQKAEADIAEQMVGNQSATIFGFLKSKGIKKTINVYV
jgi:hypothetical protein